MDKIPFFSIIIPFYVDVPRFYSDLKKFSKLNYSKYEILVVTDNPKVKIKQKRLRVIYTKQERTGPAEKRDIAIKFAKGDICAFIDDDAYPDKKWLSNAAKIFKDSNIAAVGGPGITPKEDAPLEQITGLIYESFFCSGLAQYRFKKMKKRFVEDYPAYNLIVRKTVLKKVGGYGNHFYGGEDTFLCLKIINSGFKILYSPSVVVFHHRRALFKAYLKQIANIGRHRGYFAKVYPETSRRLMYFMPSLLTILLSLSPLSLFLPIKYLIFEIVVAAILLYILVKSFPDKISLRDKLLGVFGVILTHVIYGINFIFGLVSSSLVR